VFYSRTNIFKSDVSLLHSRQLYGSVKYVRYVLFDVFKHSEQVSLYFQNIFLLDTRNRCFATVIFTVSFVLGYEYQHFNYFPVPVDHKV